MNIILIFAITYILIIFGVIYQIYKVSDDLEDAGMQLKSSKLSNAGRNMLYIAVILIITLLINCLFLFIYSNEIFNYPIF